MKKPFIFRTRRIALTLPATILGVLFASISIEAQTPAQDRESTRLNNHAIELGKQNKEREAIDFYNRALSLTPLDETVLHNRAVTFGNLRQFDKALQDADELVRRFPNDTRQLTLRGWIYFSERQFDKGKRDYEKAIALDPDNLEIHEEYVEALHGNYLYEDYEFALLRFIGLRTEAGLHDDKKWKTQIPPRSFSHYQPILILNGEIRFDGRVNKIDPKTGTLVIEVAGFGLPNGRYRPIGYPKTKAVKIGEIEIEWPSVGTVPLQLLKPGDFITLIGPDKKREFLPRRIFLSQFDTLSDGITARFQGEKFPEVEEQMPVPKDEAIQEAALLSDEDDLDWPLTFVGLDEGGPILFAVVSNLFYRQPKVIVPPAQKLPAAERIKLARQVPGEIKWNQSERKRQLLKVESVHLGSGTYSEHEIIAVRLKNAPATIPLAKERPKRGDIVWIAGNYGGYRSYIATTVMWSDARHLVLRGTYGDEDGRQVSSVVLNLKGEAVGIVLGVQEETAFAAPVDALRRVAKTPAIPTTAEKP